MNFFRKGIKYLVYLILPAVCYLIYNSAANIHSHQFHGNVVTHAHPFSKNTDSTAPVQNHNHTKIQFFALDQVISFFFFLICNAGALLLIQKVHKSRLFCFDAITTRNVYYKNRNLRAPPFQL